MHSIYCYTSVVSCRAGWPTSIHHTVLYSHFFFSLTLLPPYLQLADSRVSQEEGVPASALSIPPVNQMLWDDDWLLCVQRACSVSEAEIVQSAVPSEVSGGLFLSHEHSKVFYVGQQHECTLMTLWICVFDFSEESKTKNDFVNIQSHQSQLSQ